MKLPLSLIKSFVHLDMPPVKIGEVLTLLGIEVDRIEPLHPPFAQVVVGEILSVKNHPDAKHLQIAEVSDGAKTHVVVCAAPNCRAGIKTAFARIGALLTDADGLQRRIEKTSIRGIESHGMLCSAAELQFSKEQGEILELPYEMKNGEDLTGFLWDPIFELSLTPNLGHCMSAFGVARELSAALQIPLLRPKAVDFSVGPLDKQIIVHNAPLCPRYLCCAIEGVTVSPSSFWLKRQLEACGQKSVNHVVDAANYIMMKWGQPLHAFDWDLLEGKTIEVGPAKSAQKFLGLDGIEREILEGTLLISDARKPIAIAGIMGGANRAVSAKTTRILLEAAYFDPMAIRSASKKLSLRSESSQRFEKGIDPEGIEAALYEACQLIGGTVKGIADVKKGTFTPKEIPYRSSRINQILGTKLSASEMEEIFQRLGFKNRGDRVEVPPYRTDIAEEIDLVEEIARIYGYNNIEKPAPSCTISQVPNDPMYLFENEVRHRLTGLGLFEWITCDLISPKLAEMAQEITPPSMGLLQAKYCKSEEYSILRTSLLLGLLQTAKGNFAQKNQNIAAFEIGRIHFLQDRKVVEIPMAAILMAGKTMPSHWSYKSADVDFFDLKGIVESLLQATFIPSQHAAFHPSRQTDVHVEGLIVGSLGEVHPSLLEKFDIPTRIYYAELNLAHLLKYRKTHLHIAPLPQFPSSERDWTIPLDPKMPIDAIFQTIRSFPSPLLEKMELIDLYHPEGAVQKNATFRFTYRDPLKTISFEEVENEHAKMMQCVGKLLAK